MGFEHLKLEKGMYHEGGKSFSQVLEQLDPSAGYKGTAYEHMDAFQRQLKRFDIRVKGPGSDCVEKFFSTMDSAVLFPEYVARTVRQGMEAADCLKDMVATVTKIDAMDYRSIYSAPAKEDKQLKDVAEGASIPETNVKIKEHLTKLKKRGRMLVASYEAIRFQKLDLFSVMLRQIGAYIAQQQMEDAVSVLRLGDGNDNPAKSYLSTSEEIGGQDDTMTYEMLVRFWNLFHPYEMNTMVVSPDVLVKLLSIEEMKNPLAGLNFQGTGTMIAPLGAKLIRCGSLDSGSIIGLDRNYALEMVQAGDVLVEYDKLIDRQLERAAITTICGFSKIQTDAVNVLTMDPAVGG